MKNCFMAVTVAVIVPMMPSYSVLGLYMILVVMMRVLTNIIVSMPTLVNVEQVRVSDPTRWRVNAYPQPLMKVNATDRKRVMVPVVYIRYFVYKRLPNRVKLSIIVSIFMTRKLLILPWRAFVLVRTITVVEVS